MLLERDAREHQALAVSQPIAATLAPHRNLPENSLWYGVACAMRSTQVGN